MVSQTIHFTKKRLESLIPPKKREGAKGSTYDTYHDQDEKGLVLIVTSGGSKTFYLYKKVGGRPEKMKLGPFPDLSIEKARAEAHTKKSSIAAGINPNQAKRQLNEELTLGLFFEEYMSRFSRKHKRSWKYDEREIPQRMGEWFPRKLSKITQQDIRLKLEKLHDDSGPIAANHFLQRIKAMYNKAIEWGWQGANPAIGIKQYNKKSRERFIQPDEFAKFFAAVEQEHLLKPLTADFIMVALFTGGRKSNVLAMQWSDINLERAQWRIPLTKNGDPQTVVLSSQVVQILTERFKHRDPKCPWVFPSPRTSNQSHLQDPKKAWKRVLTASGITDLRIHDLRRTLGSYQAFTGANSYIIGKSLGHKDQQSTQIYARPNLDPVRDSVQKATDAMFEQISPKKK